MSRRSSSYHQQLVKRVISTPIITYMLTLNYCSQSNNNIDCMGKLKIWATQEDEILIRASNAAKSKKWKKASEELKRQGFDRSDVQCRERYINHLDPGVNKEGWTDQQLEILYNKYGEYGNKWFILQKHLPGRTQTKIKNYFYGRIRFFLKLIVKIILKENTGFIGDIKTQTLLDIYQAKNKFKGFPIIQRTIKRLKYKIEKKTCMKFIKENREEFQNFANYFADSCSTNRKMDGDSSEDDEYSENQEFSKQNEPTTFQPIKISLVTSTSGKICNVQQEKDYLKRMAELHLKQYQVYQKAYLNLLEQKQLQNI